MGFEPTRLSPYELESYPLDRSGTNTLKSIAREGFDPSTSGL